MHNEGEEFWNVATRCKWHRYSNNNYHYEYACFQLLCMAPKIQLKYSLSYRLYCTYINLHNHPFGVFGLGHLGIWQRYEPLDLLVFHH